MAISVGVRAQDTGASLPPGTNTITGSTGNWITTLAPPLDRHWYSWEPQPDITPYELALGLAAILPNVVDRNPFRTHVELIDDLPPEVKRHFVLHDPEFGE
jgi:hypothetical protein